MDIINQAGEAIGKVGRRLSRRRREREVRDTLARWSARVPVPTITRHSNPRSRPRDEVIDVEFRICDDEQESDAVGGISP